LTEESRNEWPGLFLNRQTMPAFGPPPINDGLSGLGFHSTPEPVGTVTLQIARLKSSFAHGLSFD
jgi:hypothetical protein